MTTASPSKDDLTLVLGATGKTGSRIASRLRALGRQPKDVSQVTLETAATNLWRATP
ncbi:MAG: hypothetical protein AAGD01_18020 [Acidobacteriota bacterium]